MVKSAPVLAWANTRAWPTRTAVNTVDPTDPAAESEASDVESVRSG